MPRPTGVLLAVAAGWTLACSGLDLEPSPDPTPPAAPAPAPEPTPEPAPDAADCSRFHGLKLPLSGGVITACEARSVTIVHRGEDPRAKRWDYAEHYKGRGWRQGDPNKGNPTVVKSPKTLVFEVDGNAIVVRLR